MSPNASGTYNNQYMVLDLKKVTLKKSIDRGALYVVEQIPTYVEYSDQTNILRKGTSSSYSAQTVLPVLVRCFHFCCDTLRGKKVIAMENS